MIYFISGQKIIENEDIKEGTIAQCLEYFYDKDIIEVDTETEQNKYNPDKLPDPYSSKVLCLQLGDKDNQFVIDNNTIDITPLRVLFEDDTKIKILCNAFFDLRFFHHWKFKVKNVYDIFIAECILTKGKKMEKGYKGLQGMGQRYLNIFIDKEVRGQIHWRGLDTKVIRYAAGDVIHMNAIREKQLVEIKKRGLESYLKLENRYVIDLSKMAYKGFKLDPIEWLKVKQINQERLTQLVNQLDNEINKLLPQTSLFAELTTVNWNSSKQVLELWKKLGIDTTVRDKSTSEDKDSVDIKHLKKQSHKFLILPIYIEYKETQKEISTYGEKFLKENLNPISGRIHSEFFQILETSRISSNNPNLQNIPGSDSQGNVHPLRKCFIPEKNNKLVICDFSQQEPRITAEYSGDPYLIDFILNGDGDSHSLISTMISEYLLGSHQVISKKNNPLVAKYNRRIRDIGKMINLGKDYGKTAFSIKDDLEISQEEAQKLLDIIDSKTPKKTAYFKRCQQFVADYGYIVSDQVFQSKTYFYAYEEYLQLKQMSYEDRTNEQNKRFYKLKGEMDRFAQNNPIQNTGALMTKLAHIYINNEIEVRGWEDKAWIANAVHDELDGEANEDIAEEFSKIMQDCMLKSGSYFCKTIPMKVDPAIEDSWQH